MHLPQLSLDILGCPLFEYGQHFFVDMGTGTTADNMYYVTSLEHTLSPGNFTTSLGLTFSASGTVKNFRSVLEAAVKPVDDTTRETKP